MSSSVPWAQAAVGAPRGCVTREGICLPLTVTFNAASLARGTYTGIVTVRDPNALDAPQNITVTVQIGGGVPDQVNLYVAPNGSSDAVAFSANQTLIGTPSTQSGGAWLSLALDGGGSFRFAIPHKIIARHLEDMAEGVYNGSLAITGSNVAAENKTVPVRLQVTSQPIARATPGEVTFRLATGAPAQQAFVSVSNGGLGTLNVTGVAAASSGTGGNWLSATANGNLVTVKADVAGVNAGSYTGTVTVSTNGVNNSLSIPVRLDVVAASTPLAVFEGILNSGNFDGALAPGSVAALFGEQLSFENSIEGTTIPLARDLGGLRVLVNDQPAPLFFTSYNQINFQIPYETPVGDAVIRVERGGQRGNSLSVPILARAPRIIQVGDSGVVVNSDGSLAIRGGRPARPGDAITIYCVGLGATSPVAATGAAAPGAEPLAHITPIPRVIVGNAFSGFAEITPFYIGLTPSLVGLYQVNIILPLDVPQGEIAMFIEGDGYRSNSVIVPIRQQ
ncbi:MAG TPA: hypothetical protein VM120_10075 [Bryobacteraceae bacterium]|nr:hypothetical protein [Bryobacteraceae bacterium]